MDFLIKILSILSAEMLEPHSYGWFHLLFVTIIAGLTVFLCIKFKDSDDNESVKKIYEEMLHNDHELIHKLMHYVHTDNDLY